MTKCFPASRRARAAHRLARGEAASLVTRTKLATSLATSLGLVAWLLACTSVAVAADVAPEKVGNVFELPAKPGPHWFWASDILLHRSALFDAADGRMLGT